MSVWGELIIYVFIFQAVLTWFLVIQFVRTCLRENLREKREGRTEVKKGKQDPWDVPEIPNAGVDEL